MDCGIKFAFLVENRIELLFVADVDLVECRHLAGDALDAGKRLLGAVAKVVHNRHFMPGVEQLHHGMAADESGSSGNENLHFVSSFS